MSKVLIVGCGFPQLSLIRRAVELGLEVVGADRDASAIGVGLCHRFLEVSTSDVEGLVQAAKREGVRGITTTGSEVSLKATAAAAVAMGLPFYADPETVRRCQEKDAMRAGYLEAGLPVPAYASCRSLEEALAFATREGLPLVVKPARGWGQRGVARVDALDQLAPAFASALYHSTQAGLEVAVVESCLEGREYSVNGWIEEGTLVSYCVTERVTFPGRSPLGVMVAEVYGSELSTEQEFAVVEAARRAARALGHLRGPCYSQVMLSATKGARVLETAARMGGGFDADVTRLASGVDLYQRILGVALGREEWESVGPDHARHGGAVAKFLIASPGRVKAIEHLEEARALPGIEDVQLFVQPGGLVHPLTDGSKRAGYVLAHGTDRAEALARADRALASVHILTETP